MISEARQLAKPCCCQAHRIRERRPGGGQSGEPAQAQSHQHTCRQGNPNTGKTRKPNPTLPSLPACKQVNGESFNTTGKAKVFTVSPGKKYRFRTICGTSSWGLAVSVADHNITLIAANGAPIEPTLAAAFRVTPGERVDFVLAAGMQGLGVAWVGLADRGCLAWLDIQGVAAKPCRHTRR